MIEVNDFRIASDYFWSMSALVPDFWGPVPTASDSGKLVFFVPRKPEVVGDDADKIGFTADVVLRLTADSPAIDDASHHMTIDEYLIGPDLAETA